MMGPDELRDLCRGFRDDRKTHTDEALVVRIEADVKEYRRLYGENPVQLPVQPLDELLPLMGWLIYEASWDSVQQMVSGFDWMAQNDSRRQASETALMHIERVADAARSLPWPEFAGRALGAIRSQALGESKRDTEAGFDAAVILHQEGKRRYESYRDCHGSDVVNRARFIRDLDEILLQLALAETGTACRTAERVIGRWAEEFRAQDEEMWIQRMFRQLTDGLDVGDVAIDNALKIEQEHGLVDIVDEHRLTMKTAKQNPGIMTARAALLLLAMWSEMARMGLRPRGFDNWAEWQADLLRRFERAYNVIEAEGDVIATRPDYERQFFHVRLDLALLKPGYDLPSRLSYVPCLLRNPLDETAVQELSEWLTGYGKAGRWRGFSAATMPSFVRSVVACRGRGEGDRAYQDWRLRWFEYEQFAEEDGRRRQVEEVLAAG